ncbi:MAG: hypothetical protein ACYS0G_13690 [Planctomycetota bacterium]|jgi:hypothetical protein
MVRATVVGAVILTGVFQIGCGAGESGAATQGSGTPSDAYLAVQAHSRKGEWGDVYDCASATAQDWLDDLSKFSADSSGRVSGGLSGRDLFIQWMNAEGNIPGELVGDIVSENIEGHRATLEVRLARRGSQQIHMVYENGRWKMEMGWDLRNPSSPTDESEPARTSGPRDRGAKCQEAALAVRAGIANFYANEAISNRIPRFPTLAELLEGKVMQDVIPSNPYNDDNRVAAASKADADQRRIVGSGEGWAYYDGSSGGSAVFYANTNEVGENRDQFGSGQ